MNVIRQYTRDLSVLQRSGAMSALDRIKRDDYLVSFRDALEAPQNDVGTMIANFMQALLSFAQYILIQTPRNILHDQLVCRNRRIDSYSEYEFRELFGINQYHARAVMTAWGVFEEHTVTDNRMRIHPEEAFLIYLGRMHDYRKLTSLEREFGRDYSQLSRIFNKVSHQMCLHHFDRLFNNLPFFEPRFAMYNDHIRRKCLAMYPGEGLPPDYQNVCGFQDGTRLEISRPGGDEAVQMRCFNGKDRIHCLEFQGVSFPDGMIGDLYGPVPGSRHDSYISRVSRIMDRMRDCQIGRHVQYGLYRDKAYCNIPPWGYAAHRKPNAPLEMDPALAHENRVMSKLRLGVEWAFGKVMTCTRFLGASSLCIYMSGVAQYYINAVILANTHTCLYGAQASVYFVNCRPPTLAQYFGVNVNC